MSDRERKNLEEMIELLSLMEEYLKGPFRDVENSEMKLLRDRLKFYLSGKRRVH
jgi:hypothetical protein